jgi:hypothetical protein
MLDDALHCCGMSVAGIKILISCIKYIKIATNALWLYGCNFIAQWSPTCFSHPFGHLQGGENKNMNVIKMCLNHATV